MKYARLGGTGLRVSRIGLGCMSHGDAATGMHRWTLDEDASAPFFRQAVELGVTFWDTANVYQGGTSEEFVGRAITRFSRREDIVLAPKVNGKMRWRGRTDRTIVGATKVHHLQDAVAALDLDLTDAEITRLEESYTPQDNFWW